MQQTSSEVAVLLRRMAAAIEQSKPVARLEGESIFVPPSADVSVQYESGTEKRMIINVTWSDISTAPQLIRQHSDQVRDQEGQIYDVMIYGEPVGNIWEGWIDFVPASPNLPSRRTGRETTQPDRTALEYWATGLEPLYLAGAFERSV